MAIPNYSFQNQNIDTNVDDASKFTRGDRVILYSRKSNSTDAFQAIGLVQGFTHSEQKQIQMLYELGSATPIMVPGLASGQISINRVLLSGPDFMNVVYGNVGKTNASDDYYKSLRDINIPFDLMIAKYAVENPTTNSTQNTPAATTDGAALSHIIFGGCYIQARSESISPGGVITVENLSIMYKKVLDIKVNDVKTK